MTVSESGPGLDLEKLQIVARPRLHWEALDLGVRIARRWYPLLLASWLALALPIFALTWLCMPEHPLWSILIVWWLKPVYERIPLRILSTAIFGSTPTLEGALRGAGTAIWPGILRMLTYRRLSPNRSFEAPVWVLERPKQRGLGRRVDVLQARAGSGAFWLTVLGVHVEAFLVLGAVTGVYLLIPANMEVDWWGLVLSGSEGAQDWLVNLLTLGAMAVVAPIYVACGFALYLNRRIELEGWDLELGFRRLARRRGAALVILLAAAFNTPNHEVRAADGADWYGPDPVMEQRSATRQRSREVVHEVLSGPDFNAQTTLKYPKFLRDWFTAQRDQSERGEQTWAGGEWLKAIAWAAEIVLWACVVTLAIWIVHRSRLLDLVRRSRREKRAAGPREIFGLDISEDSLPEDIAGQASVLWAAGDKREALSLVYRGALGALMHRHACELSEADTEGDCLVKAQAVLTPAGTRYFSALTHTWQRVAYAHTLPSESAFAELCAQFDAALEEAVRA